MQEDIMDIRDAIKIIITTTRCLDNEKFGIKNAR